MPRMLFAFRKDEAAVTHTAAKGKKVKRRFGRGLLVRSKKVDESHYGDTTSIVTHLGTSSETVSSSEPPQKQPPSPSSFRISILEVRYDENHQNEMMMVSPSSSSSLGSAPPVSVARAAVGGRSSSRVSDAAAAAAAKQRYNHQHRHMPPSPPTCTNVAVQQKQRNISFPIGPSDEQHAVPAQEQDFYQPNFLRRKISVAPATGPLCYWLPNSTSDAAATTTTTGEAPQPKTDKHVSFSSDSSSPPRRLSSTENHQGLPQTLRDEIDFDICKARNSFSLTDDIIITNHENSSFSLSDDNINHHHDSYLARRAVHSTATTPPMATSRPYYDKRQQYSQPEKKVANHIIDDDDDDTVTVGVDSLGMILGGGTGFPESSIFAAKATANRSPYNKNFQSHSFRTRAEEKQHDYESEESIVLFSNHHHPHFQPPTAMTRVVTGPVPLPPTIPHHDHSSNTAITRQNDDSSPSNNTTGLVRFSDRILCYGGGSGTAASGGGAGGSDAASISSSLQEPPSLAGCMGGGYARNPCKSTNSEEGSLVTKSTVASGGGDDFSMYREMQDLLYDVTFFWRCMSDAFLSDEKGSGGGHNDTDSSILDSSPSVVDAVVGDVIVLTSTRIPSALKPNPQYSPPRRRFATVTSAAESPDRFHQEHDNDDDGGGSAGGGDGTPSSSPSSQSRQSSSTGGTYSYTNTNDDGDNSTDASSSRHTSPSMYS